MIREEFAPRLFAAFPPFRTQSDKIFDHFGDEAPGSYLLFEDILVPEIETAAGNDPAYLAQLMSFVEEVAEPGFGNCDDLVHIGLGEWLPDSAHYDQIKAAAGPHTIEAITSCERHLYAARQRNKSSPLTALMSKLITTKKDL